MTKRLTYADKLYHLLQTGKHWLGMDLVRATDSNGARYFRNYAQIDRAVTALRKRDVVVRKVDWGNPNITYYYIPKTWLRAKAKRDAIARDRFDRKFARMIGIDPDAKHYDRWFGS